MYRREDALHEGTRSQSLAAFFPFVKHGMEDEMNVKHDDALPAMRNGVVVSGVVLVPLRRRLDDGL